MVSVGDDCRCLNRTTTCDARFHESSVFGTIRTATSFSLFTHKSLTLFSLFSFYVNILFYLFIFVYHPCHSYANYPPNPG